MTSVEMREAKAELHKIIIDTIIKYQPTESEFIQLLDYVENLIKVEKTY